MNTLTQIRTDLKARLDVETGNSYWSDSVLNIWINLAQEDVASSRPWLALQKKDTSLTTVADQENYDMPSDYMSGTFVWAKINEATYDWVSPVVYRNENLTLSNRVTVFENDLWIKSTPSVSGYSIELWYQKKPTTLSEDADTISVKSELAPAIVYKAMAMAVERDPKQTARATYFDKKAEAILKKYWKIEKPLVKVAKKASSVLDFYKNYSNSGNV